MDQISFGCDVGDKQYVYFTWNVGVTESPSGTDIQWVTPITTHRTFPSSMDTEYVILLHNSGASDETLHSSQVSWLLQRYDLHDCKPLDVADATENDPRIISATPPDQAMKAGAAARSSSCNQADQLVATASRKGSPFQQVGSPHMVDIQCRCQNFRERHSAWVLQRNACRFVMSRPNGRIIAMLHRIKLK